MQGCASVSNEGLVNGSIIITNPRLNNARCSIILHLQASS